MKIRPITLIAFVAVAAALVAWGALAVFAWNIMSEESKIRSHATYTEAVTARENVSMGLNALARDTKSGRDQLDSLTRKEVLEIANIIEGVGKSTGVTVKIGGATSEPVTQKSGKSITVNTTMHAVNFIVDAEGTFSSVMHTALLFENLPAISSIQSLQLVRVQNSGDSAKAKTKLWRLSARIQVITTANISS
ncbi:MAG: hypothetical protein Q7S75_02120 [bacterium]|nr:hypothetical protein [bacterium]